MQRAADTLDNLASHISDIISRPDVPPDTLRAQLLPEMIILDLTKIIAEAKLLEPEVLWVKGSLWSEIDTRIATEVRKNTFD